MLTHDATIASIAYPSRERQDCVYAIRYIRWLIETEATVEAGPDAFALLVAVAIAEDRIRFSRPANFYNEQLCRSSGIGSVPALIRARNRAVELGLLHYSSGAKRRPGTYFVYGFPNDSLQKAEGIRTESETKTTPSIPSPIPSPITKPISCAAKAAASDPELDSWIRFWNDLKAEGLVHAGVSKVPSKGVLAGWNRVKKNCEIRDLLSDRAAVRAAIVKSEFIRSKSWFTLGCLFGGSNKHGEYYTQKLMDGGYANSVSALNPQRPAQQKMSNLRYIPEDMRVSQ